VCNRGAEMRALKILMVVMGVMIIAGVAVLVVTIGQRLSVPVASTAPAVLDEPAGTHITQITANGDRLNLLLQGGGPDRVVVFDQRLGHVTSRIGLAP
jgi:hypothetical protein